MCAFSLTILPVPSSWPSYSCRLGWAESHIASLRLWRSVKNIPGFLRRPSFRRTSILRALPDIRWSLFLWFPWFTSLWNNYYWHPAALRRACLPTAPGCLYLYITFGCASAHRSVDRREDRPQPPSLLATGWLPLGLWLDGSIIILLRLSSPSIRLHPYRLSPEGSFRSVRSCGLCGSRVTHTAENVKVMLLFCFQGSFGWADLSISRRR